MSSTPRARVTSRTPRLRSGVITLVLVAAASITEAQTEALPPWPPVGSIDAPTLLAPSPKEVDTKRVLNGKSATHGGVAMFARMLVADCPPEKRDRDSVARLVHDEVIPFVERERGFRGVWFFLNRDSGRFFSITLYETEDDLRAALEGIKELRTRALGALGCTPVSAESLEVITWSTP